PPRDVLAAPGVLEQPLLRADRLLFADLRRWKLLQREADERHPGRRARRAFELERRRPEGALWGWERVLHARRDGPCTRRSQRPDAHPVAVGLHEPVPYVDP